MGLSHSNTLNVAVTSYDYYGKNQLTDCFVHCKNNFLLTLFQHRPLHPSSDNISIDCNQLSKMKSQSRAAAGLQLTLADAENLKMQFKVSGSAVGRSGDAFFIFIQIPGIKCHDHHSSV